MKAIYHLENFQITNMQSWTSARKNEYCINFFNMKVFLELSRSGIQLFQFLINQPIWSMISQYVQFWYFFLPSFVILKPPVPMLWMMDRLFPSVKEVFYSTGHFTYPVAKKQSEKRSILQEDWREGNSFCRAAMGIVRKGLITIRRTSIPISFGFTDVKQCDEF